MDNPFIHRFQSKSSEELENMVNNPEGRTPQAIEAAKQILFDRGIGKAPEPEKKIYKEEENSDGFLSKLNTTTKSIAYFQIVTFILVLPSFVYSDWLSLSDIAFMAAVSFVFASGFLGGIFLIKKKPIGFILSIISQGIQAFSLSIFGYRFFVHSLFAIYFEIGEVFHVGFSLEIAPRASISGSEEFLLGINIIAIAALIILFKAKKVYKNQNEFTEELLNESFNLNME